MATYQNPVSVFLTTYLSYGLMGIIGTNPSQPSFLLQFSSSSTKSQQDFVKNAAKTFDWVPLVPTPGPSVQAFSLAIVSDNTIPSDAQMGLASWFPQLQWFIMQPAVIKSGWVNLVSTYQSTWLTADVQAKVLAYASEFNIPLVN